MAEGNKSGAVSESRSALGDLTNLLGKRGLSDRGKIGIEGFDCAAADNNSTNKLKRAKISPGSFMDYIKRARIDALKPKSVLSSVLEVADENRDSNLGSGGGDDGLISKGLADLKEGSDDKVVKDSELGIDVADLGDCTGKVSDVCGELGKSVDLMVNGDGDDVLGSLDKCDTNEPKALGIGGGVSQCVVDVGSSEESGDSSHEAKVGETQGELNCENGLDDHCGDGFVLSQTGSVDCTFVPASQESAVFGAEKSTEHTKEDVCTNMSGFVDSIKACSCSFCTKAAHMWLDLNYQDIKARSTAMTRIQREAIILAEKMGKNKTVERHGVESFAKASSLESNLRQQWRSLFQHMAGIWEKESNQLEASLVPVSELRDKLKTELELIATSSKKH